MVLCDVDSNFAEAAGLCQGVAGLATGQLHKAVVVSAADCLSCPADWLKARSCCESGSQVTKLFSMSSSFSSSATSHARLRYLYSANLHLLLCMLQTSFTLQTLQCLHAARVVIDVFVADQVH